ncbi:MAG: hypothetical protein J7L11_04335 [Thermoprotei archaeon]|nr:hypothetical protein [Thermoprotei archaeon]
MTSRVETIESELSSLRDELTSISSKIDTVSSTVESIQERVTGLPSAAEMEALRGQVSSLSSIAYGSMAIAIIAIIRRPKATGA